MNFFPKAIYKYQEEGEVKLCVYICNTDKSKEIIVGCIENFNDLNNDYIKMENGLNKVLYLDRYKLIRESDVISPLYIKGKHIEITSNEFYKLTDNICKLLMIKFEKLVDKFNYDNYDCVNDRMKDIMLPEKMIKLLTWNIKKCELKFKKNQDNLIIMKYAIYFAYLGTNIGSEIEKLRPVLVWKSHQNNKNPSANIYYVFPITSKKQKKEYYFNIKIKLNGKTNYIKLDCGQMISINRFFKPYIDEDEKVCKIDIDTQKKIKQALKIFFGIKI